MMKFIGGVVLGVLGMCAFMAANSKHETAMVLFLGLLVGILGTVVVVSLFLAEMRKPTVKADDMTDDEKDRWWARGDAPPWDR